MAEDGGTGAQRDGGSLIDDVRSLEGLTPEQQQIREEIIRALDKMDSSKVIPEEKAIKVPPKQDHKLTFSERLAYLFKGKKKKVQYEGVEKQFMRATGRPITPSTESAGVGGGSTTDTITEGLFSDAPDSLEELTPEQKMIRAKAGLPVNEELTPPDFEEVNPEPVDGGERLQENIKKYGGTKNEAPPVYKPKVKGSPKVVT